MIKILLLFILLVFWVVATNAQTIRLLTFNIWDVFVAPERSSRTRAIIAELLNPTPKGAVYSQYDVLAFQEMWSASTFKLFKNQLDKRYPHSHYYQSGAIGSGLAIFSAHPIVRVEFRGFSLNGHPARFFEGDWLAGKGIGYARIRHPAGLLDVFTTHMIADYNNWHSRWRNSMHRTVQIYELMRFVEGNTDPQGLGAIILGDLNTGANNLAWRAIIQANGFTTVTQDEAGLPRCTCNCPDNPYTPAKEAPLSIDHIIYRLENFPTPPKTAIVFLKPLENYGIRGFSDHFALTAEFDMGKQVRHLKSTKVKSDHTLLLQISNSLSIYLEALKSRLPTLTWLTIGILLLHVLGISWALLLDRNDSKNPSFYGMKFLVAVLPLISFLLFLYLALLFLFYPVEIARLQSLVIELALIINSG